MNIDGQTIGFPQSNSAESKLPPVLIPGDRQDVALPGPESREHRRLSQVAHQAQDTQKGGLDCFASETELVSAASWLAKGDSEEWSAAERKLIRNLPKTSKSTLLELHRQIAGGLDPLGEAFCRIRSASARRTTGATYTPADIVRSIIEWSAGEGVEPARIVDPGAGSGRFIAAAADRFPSSRLVAVESDPTAALMLRATAECRGFSNRMDITVADYRSIRLPAVGGRTLFIGNPPYVRHHDVEVRWKHWYASTAERLGIKASKLAGLHLHFFFKTMGLARSGDFGAFITAAEWLDTNYGSALRSLLADGLGGTALHVLNPEVAAFPGTSASAAITCFRVGSKSKSLRVRSVTTRASLGDLCKGRKVAWKEMGNAARWSPIIHRSKKPPSNHIELGELFRVHRGQVTGANGVWIAGQNAMELPPHVLLPTVTRARELISSGGILSDSSGLRRVVDLPADLDELPRRSRSAVERFLTWAKSRNAHSGYVARNRRSWWSVGLRDPAPIVCTYMARRPPAFVRNSCGARLLNVAHGLYPREHMTEEVITSILAWLNVNVRTDAGRTYAGGLTKFEPKEVERILILHPDFLHA